MALKLRALRVAEPVSEPKKTTEVDAYVGQRLRLRRSILGLRQEDLADALGITHQQVQKYECGETRISFARLYEASCFLDVSLAWFVDGLETALIRAAPSAAALDPETERDLMLLHRLLAQVPDAQLRKKILHMARLMVET